MQKRLLRWELIGFAFTGAVGTLLHFVYEWAGGDPLIAAFCAVNESTWEQLHTDGAHPRCEVTDELLSLVDVLVDGRFVEELHDISLRFRGSSNQRIIDVPRTLSSGGITLWEDQ